MTSFIEEWNGDTVIIVWGNAALKLLLRHFGCKGISFPDTSPYVLLNTGGGPTGRQKNTSSLVRLFGCDAPVLCYDASEYDAQHLPCNSSRDDCETWALGIPYWHSCFTHTDFDGGAVKERFAWSDVFIRELMASLQHRPMCYGCFSTENIDLAIRLQCNHTTCSYCLTCYHSSHQKEPTNEIVSLF